jgi:ribulose-5-phosphate 4-epimerase/fuculose-1-phosphate aldolase
MEMEHFKRPGAPVLNSVEEERRYRKERLAGAFRVFAKMGYDYGVSGHITARDPEYPDHFWVNPMGLHFDSIKVSDLLLVNHKGEIIEGKGVLNQAAFAIHSAIHAARPDIVAAAHAHTIYGEAWSTLGRLLDPITQDSCYFYNDHSIFNSYTGEVLDKSDGEKIAEALGNNKAIILQNHGLLTVGKTVDSAAWWFITMDRSCKVQLLAEAAGKPVLIPSHIAQLTRNQIGSEDIGWFSFQPYWNSIVREQPDLLE